MADYRAYAGVDFSAQFLAHYGVGHENGGHSGRYEWGSGDRPMQDSPLDKGSESKPFRYVPSKSIESSMHKVAKKLKENKITIETIHTARADASKANQEYLQLLGYGSDKKKETLNKEAKDQQVLVVKADNHKNRPHARTQKIAEGTAEVKINNADSNGQHLPAIYSTSAYMNYVPTPYGNNPKDLQTIDGTTNAGSNPKPKPLYMTEQEYYALTQKPTSSNTFLSYYGQEKRKLDKVVNSPVTKLVLGMAKVANKVVKALKKLKNVIVSAFKHSDDGFLLVDRGSTSNRYIGIDSSTRYLKHSKEKKRATAVSSYRSRYRKSRYG